jgi:hypothetical protein
MSIILLEWLVRHGLSQVPPFCSIVSFVAPRAIDLDKSVNSCTVLSCDSVTVASSDDLIVRDMVPKGLI